MNIYLTDPVGLVLKDLSAAPNHARPYAISYSQEQKLKEEVDRLCEQAITKVKETIESRERLFQILIVS